MGKAYRKTYDRRERTYRYVKNDGTNSFIVFRAGFGGCEEWVASKRSDNSAEAHGFPTMYQAVLTYMGSADMEQWMIDREVA
jgi:hypothetical protein